MTTAVAAPRRLVVSAPPIARSSVLDRVAALPPIAFGLAIILPTLAGVAAFGIVLYRIVVR